MSGDTCPGFDRVHHGVLTTKKSHSSVARMTTTSSLCTFCYNKRFPIA